MAWKNSAAHAVHILVTGVLGILLVFPWLNPWSSGPMPAAIPWLLCAGCASLVWALRFGLTQQVVVAAWWVAALLSACMALLQYFGYAHLASGWVNHAAIGDAYANLRQRNQFATLTSIGLLALICQLTRDTRETRDSRDGLDERPWPLRWVLGLGGVLLLAFGNAASGSRTGWLQWWLVAILALLWWWRAEQEKGAAGTRRRGGALLALVALGAYLAAIWALPVVLEAVTGFHSDGLLGRFRDDEGCGGRRLLWSNVLYLIAQKPWLGWGWGELDYAHFVTLYPGARFCDILDNAHNLPLHLAVELGIPLALAVCGALAWLVWRARPWRERDAARQLAWGVLAVVGLHSLVEYPLWYGPFQIAVGLCLWLLWHKPLQRQYFSDAFSDTFWPPSHARQAGAAIVFIAFLAYVGWDYWRISQIYQSPSVRAEAYRSDTLNKVRNTWFFQNQVLFAELTTTPLSSGNAQYLHALAQDLLHFSPEPRVIEKVIESAVLLKQDEEALFYLQRFRAAFPQQHAQWTHPVNGTATP